VLWFNLTVENLCQVISLYSLGACKFASAGAGLERESARARASSFIDNQEVTEAGGRERERERESCGQGGRARRHSMLLNFQF